MFNRENREAALKTQKKLAPTTRVPANALNYVPPSTDTTSAAPRGSKTEAVDHSFFNRGMAAPSVRGKASANMRGGFSRVTLYPHQTMVDASGRPLSRRERVALAQASDDAALTSKKHHKKGKKNVKVRSGAGYNDYTS